MMMLAQVRWGDGCDDDDDDDDNWDDDDDDSGDTGEMGGSKHSAIPTAACSSWQRCVRLQWEGEIDNFCFLSGGLPVIWERMRG